MLDVEQIAIHVTPEENREYSYTDKRSGFYYGRTHEDRFGEWFAGWNLAKRRIFSDYTLFVDDAPLSRSQAEVTVYPYRVERVFAEATEDFRLVDDRALLYIGMYSVQGDSIAIALEDENLSQPGVTAEGLSYIPREYSSAVLTVVPYRDQPVTVRDGIVKAPATAEGFLVVCGTEEDNQRLIAEFRSQGEQLLTQRRDRMNDLITKNNPVRSNLDELDRALAWLLLTTDELVTDQQGKGIYAGLPWFNEYWGRDMFISMPGSTLVTGQFETTRDIFSDFSRLQDTDPKSITLGRIPNRANLEAILYNTTDGTPRFVIQIDEYIRYSGDTAYIREIYPAVKLSIDASIQNYTDERGYLVHEDADTWMDVKRKGIPGSPRGNRANDIQALWYHQLLAGTEMASYIGDLESAARWEQTAQNLKTRFEADYANKAEGYIVDHLNRDGSADLQYRPNQLYTFELIDDEDFKMQVTRRVWEELVYPWGVSSLSQEDEDFHPQHENWNYYHKDDAYHNGTVWLWNNGHAMQRMIEMNQPDIAWQLFTNMNRQALIEGAVGSLSENADAHPREGASWANRSGTFLQAWSNAEQLRVWYQYFLGIRPHMNHPELSGLILAEPKLPSEITDLYWKERVGKGYIEGTYQQTGKKATYTYTLTGQKGHIALSVGVFPEVIVPVSDGSVLTAVADADQLHIRVVGTDGKEEFDQICNVSPEKKALKEKQDKFFESTRFAQPVYKEGRKAFDTYYEIPLTYE